MIKDYFKAIFVRSLTSIWKPLLQNNSCIRLWSNRINIITDFFYIYFSQNFLYFKIFLSIFIPKFWLDFFISWNSNLKYFWLIFSAWVCFGDAPLIKYFLLYVLFEKSVEKSSYPWFPKLNFFMHNGPKPLQNMQTIFKILNRIF